jgi:hypothetical protein
MAVRPTDMSNEWVRAIAEELGDGPRTRARIADVAARHRVGTAFVEAVARHVDHVIYETAPAVVTTKGPPMTTIDNVAGAISRVYREHGTGPHIDRAVSEAFGIPVSAAHAAGEAVRKVITEAGGTLRESAPAPLSVGPAPAAADVASAAFDAQRLAKAAALADQANTASSREPSTWTYSDMAAMASFIGR